MIKDLIKKIMIFSTLLLLIGMVILPSTTSNLNIKSTKNSEILSLNIDDGLVAYWSFNEGSSGILIDDSGNNHDGTIYGASWTTGIWDDALNFNGNYNYVNIGNLGIYLYSINFWVKPTQTITKNTPDQGGFHFHADCPLSMGDSTGLLTDETICIHGPGDYRTGIINKDITNSWHMITLVWSTSSNRYDIYFDGVIQPVTAGISNGHTPLLSVDNFKIGWDNAGPDHNFFNGLFDEIRIYNKALSQTEIQELYDNPSGLKSTFFFGKIDDLNTEGSNFITFSALKIRSIRFSPFEFTQYTSGEKIRIYNKYSGVVLTKFIVGIFKANI